MLDDLQSTFGKIPITKTREIYSYNLHTAKQSYKYYLYDKIDQRPEKISLNRKLGLETMSMGFISSADMWNFIKDTSYAYIWWLDHRTMPPNRQEFRKAIINTLILDIKNALYDGFDIK